MFGQSYGVFKGVSAVFRLAARGCGVSPESSDKIGRIAGSYVGGWTAIITADPVGGSAIVVDVANQIDKEHNKKPPSP